jgi:hypothetical protein
MRRQLLRMVLLTVLVGAVALGVYYLLDIERASERLRMLFTVTWTAANFTVVAIHLRRIRAARRELLRRPTSTRRPL